jgi:protein SCO1/2
MARSRTVNVWLTVGALVLFMAVVIASFVHRIDQPRLMTESESRANGLYLLEVPRDIGEFALVDHHGAVFDAGRLKGQWTVIFFGFTHCPDVCPTTLSELARLADQLEDSEADATQVVMVTVDPARDTPDRLSEYVPYFNPDFIGVTGEFEQILTVAQRLNAPFRKVSAADGSYQMEHSANVVLMNPMGDYHGFFRAPLDIPKMRVTLRSAQYRWEH